MIINDPMIWNMSVTVQLIIGGVSFDGSGLDGCSQLKRQKDCVKSGHKRRIISTSTFLKENISNLG